MKKVIAIVLGIFLAAALISAAGFFVYLKFSDNTTVNTSSEQHNENGNNQTFENAFTENGASNTESNVVETETETQLVEYISDKAENELVHNIVLTLFNTSFAETTKQYVSAEIPEQFIVAENAIPGWMDNQNGLGYVMVSYFESHNPQILSDSRINSGGQYSRHVLIVDTQTAGGLGPNGEFLEPETHIPYSVNIVVDRQQGKAVLIGFRSISPNNVPMVEEQYGSVVSMIQSEGDQNKKLREQILSVYSYSPFIEQLYWDNLSHNVFAGYDKQEKGGIVSSFGVDWRLSNDGSGRRVVSLSEPELVNIVDNQNHYSLNIVYRSDHNNPDVAEQMQGSTLYAVVDNETNKIVELVEDAKTNSTVYPGTEDAIDPARNPSMIALLDLQNNM